MLSLRIDGVPAQTIGYGKVGELEVTHLWSPTGGGLHHLKFRLAIPRRYNHPALRGGATVEVFRGPVLLGTAIMAEPNREAWTFEADGLYRRAEVFNAEGSSNSPRDVVEAANTRGLGWVGYGNLPDDPIPVGANERLEKVSDVLDRYCKLNAKTWGVAANGVPYIADYPTELSWALRPGTPAMETAEDDYYSRVTVRYVSGVTGSPPQPSAYSEKSASSTEAPHGPREAYEDISSMGLLSGTDVQTYANKFIEANAARRGFTQGVEVAARELTELGNTPIEPWFAGLSVLGKRGLQYNVRDTDGNAAVGQTLSWVVGSTTWKSVDDSLVLTPVGLLPRTVATAFIGEASSKLRARKGITE